jgi:hypothetical protein
MAVFGSILVVFCVHLDAGKALGEMAEWRKWEKKLKAGTRD